MGEELPVSINKLTLSYCAIEDRVYLRALGVDGGYKKIWLTARLLNEFVRYIGRLEKQLGVWPAARREGFAEVADCVDLASCDPECTEVLVYAIDISRQSERTLLTFRDLEGEDQASFSTSLRNLGQWAEALIRCFVYARWPLENFQPHYKSALHQGENQTIVH